MKIRLSCLLCLAFLLWMSVSYASGVTLAQDLNSAETIGDDVYMVGETVSVKGKVIGDLVTLAKSISCTGQVAADLLAIGANVEVAGNINDDLRILGLLTDLCGNIGDDALLIGLKVHTGSDSRIGHNTIILAGQSAIDGTMRGDLVVTGYNTIISGNVGGNVTASVAKLQLTPTTHVKGNLIYTGQDPVQIPPGAVVEGQVIHHQPQAYNHVFYEKHAPTWIRLVARLTWDISLMFVGVLLLLLVPQTMSISSQTMVTNPFSAFFYGLLWLVGAPVLASVAAIAIIGIPIAITIAFLYLASLYLSVLPVALWIGEKAFRTPGRPYFSMMLGLLCIALLRSLPYVGFVFGIIILTVGLGSLALSLCNYLKDTRD